MKKSVLRAQRLIRQKSTNLDIHRTESWLVVGPANLSQQLGTGARFLESALERVRHALKPATSQVVDLVIALLLFFPESQVLLEKLDNALSITEVVLLELVNLVEGLLEGVIGKLACLGMILEHFVVEDGEVECETKFDWAARGKVDGVGLFVGGLSLLLYFLEFGILGVLLDGGNSAASSAFARDQVLESPM